VTPERREGSRREDWDLPENWPEDKCPVCWTENGEHALWCPEYKGYGDEYPEADR
jgi:hypothetical protein